MQWGSAAMIPAHELVYIMFLLTFVTRLQLFPDVCLSFLNIGMNGTVQ